VSGERTESAGEVEALDEGWLGLTGFSMLGVVRPLRCPRTAMPFAHLRRGP
jgi:hypothetical protein